MPGCSRVCPTLDNHDSLEIHQMIKRLGTFAAVCGLMLASALPAVASNTQSFTVSASVSTIASLSFPSSFTYNFTSTDNTNPALASTNNGSGVINANLRSTFGGGAAAIFFTAPTSVAGSGANSIPIGAFTFTCTGSYIENTGLGGAQSTNSVNTSSAAVSGSSNNNCVTFSGGHSVASSSISLNLFLDDRFIPADSYSSSGFAVVVTAS